MEYTGIAGVAASKYATVLAMFVVARAAAVNTIGYAMAVMAGKSLRQHGHRPPNDGCPSCIRANLKGKEAHRMHRGAHADHARYTINSGFSGPQSPDIDGHVQAYIGVECTTG